MTIVFLLYVVAAGLLVGGSALIFRELLIADAPPKAARKAPRPTSASHGNDVPPLRRAA